MTAKTKKPVQESSEFDFRTIKTYEDACKKENIDPLMLPDVSMIPEIFRNSIINAYKLMIIYLAINNGWVPDWNDWNQFKHFPYFRVSASGLGFSDSYYLYTYAAAHAGSRLCTDTSAKAEYIGKQFKAEYKEFLLYN